MNWKLQRGASMGSRALGVWVTAVLACLGAALQLTPVWAQEGQTCSVFKPCPAGYKCAAGIPQRCHGPGKEGDSCHLTRPCGPGLTCEAGSQKCRGPGKEGDSCHLTKPCGPGLTCEAGSQKCRAPGTVGQACHATRPCGGALTCQPSVHKCYHSPRKAGEPCAAGFGCGAGLYCQSFVQKCVPKTVDYNSNSPCSALFVQATAEDAKRANLVMSFSAGSSASAGGAASYESGVVYGNHGEFGCFATVCIGTASNVSIGNFANFGISSSWADAEGWSYVTGQGVDTPFLQLGFQTSQVFDASPPKGPNDFVKLSRLTGTSSGITFGVGLSPVTVGQAMCYTALLDGNKPLSQFKDIKGILEGWGKAGFAPSAKPANLPAAKGGGAAVASSGGAGSSCAAAVQGKIAWDYAGSKNWQPGNIAKLCGNVQTDEPARCFATAMHGGINWGGGTQWKWENALDLCARSPNANVTLHCFKTGISFKLPWPTVLQKCRTP